MAKAQAKGENVSHPQPLLSQTHPGGCYIGFNAAIDRKTAEQIAFTCADAVKNKFSEINLLLSSTGGVLDHAYYACSILDALPIKIITYNVGTVSSCANLLFLCGDERYAIENSFFYFHQTHYQPTSEVVSAAFVKNKTKSITREDNRSAYHIAHKTGTPIKDVLGWQRGELFMDTKGALASGIINGVKAPSVPQDALFHQITI